MRRILLFSLVLVGMACTGLNASITRARASMGDSGAKNAVAACERLASYRIGYEEERSLGGGVAVALVAKTPGILLDGAKAKGPDHRLEAFVDTVGKQVAAHSSRPNLPWTFAVIDSPDVNAFSTPGGYVFVTRGLLRRIHSEAALAGVLAHEVAHVTLRHALKKYKHVKLETCESHFQEKDNASVLAAAAGGAASGLTIGGTVSNALRVPGGAIDFDETVRDAAGHVIVENLKALIEMSGKVADDIADAGYDQMLEFQADHLALELTVRAGYNPRPFIAFLGALPPSGHTWPHHPDSKARAERLTDYLNGKGDYASGKKPSFVDENPFFTVKQVERFPTVPLKPGWANHAGSATTL